MKDRSHRNSNPPFGMRTMRWFGACMLVLWGAWQAQGQATDLIISEYVEGSSNNKYIELYNGTGAAVNLANYELRLYSNGAATPSSTHSLSGTLANGATIVYRNGSATIYGGATIVSSACNFNGDDAVALWKVAPAGYVDIFGNIGCDPGSAWTATGMSTLDRTVRKQANICAGVTTNPGGTCNAASFPTLAPQWDNFSQDVVSGLGSHTMTCGPTVNFVAASSSALENAGSVVVNLSLNPATTGAGTITIAVADGVGCTYGAGNDYTTTPAVVGGNITLNVGAGATTASFTITLVNDVVTESDETITFTITGATGGISLGANLVHVFTILNDDVTPTIEFSTLNITVLENAGMQNFNLSINPAAPSAGSIVIQVTNGPGATYGPNPNDYLTNPATVGGFITVNFLAGATTASFTATVINDVNPESTETVTFSINSVPGAFVIGGNVNSTLTIGDNDTPPTVLSPGDLVIVGVNSNTFACGGGSGGEDQVSFFCFKPIVPGTVIIITDNGYSRCSPGLWGNNEGAVSLTRTGLAIPAGQVITLTVTSSSGAGNIIGLAPDAAWSCTSLNGFTSVNLNSGGDQLFFAQGGTWATNTPGAHNATYDGTILYGFTTNPSIPWTANCGSNQQSDLPPGIECFSMAPTLVSDFNKFTGAITAASQRDWIIRIDDTAGWSSYPNCSDYNTFGYNWLAAPVLPIINTPFVPGLWRGTTDTDWFECKNWDDARVPTATTDVLINQIAVRNCVVGVAAGGNAVCSSLLLTTNSTAWNLTVQNASSLNIGGPMTIERTTAGAAVSATILGGSTLSATDFAVQATALNQARFVNELPANTVSFSGNYTQGLGGFVDLNLSPGVGGTVSIGGDYTSLIGDEFRFVEDGSTLVFDGTGAQSISTNGFQEFFHNLTVNKPSGSLTLNTNLGIRNVLDLSNGLVNTSDPGGLPTMQIGSSWINATDLSFVNGPMAKLGTTNFTFPVGKVNDLRPCSVTGIVGGGGFRAEYFPLSAWSWGTNREPTIDHISDCEYWEIDRVTGAPNATVVLTWEAPASCGVDDLADLVVARWDAAGTIWRDRGNGGAAGTFMSGSIPTAAVQSLFNGFGPTPWTLASTSFDNPLPITLVEFTARPEAEFVRLEWTTASEFQNAFFSVERSQDGVNFEHVMDVPGALNSNAPVHYAELDRAPYMGLSYYRLRQTDVDGNGSLSPVVAVLMGGLADRPLIVYGNADVLTAVHSFPAGSRYALMDMTGRMIAEGSTVQEGRSEFSGLGLSRGAYLFRISAGDRYESVRFVY